ncbi:MAG: DUF4293 domain-containing protein [Bacteroidales bacterium]
MIQRIQTLFLLGVAILLGFLFFLPFTSFVVEPQMVKYIFMASGLTSEGVNAESIYNTWPLFILLIVVFAIPFITIFLYKRRMLQIRLCIVNIVLLLGMQGLMYYYVVAVSKLLVAESHYSLLFIFPLASAILTFLSLRAIAKDEALIRSLERLR